MIKLGGLIDLKPITEADVFTATSKETGTTSVFKSKAARDAAIKAGTHEKRKDDKDDAVKDPTDKPKVNIFNKDKAAKGGDSSAGEKDKEEPKKAKFKDFKADIQSTMKDMGFSSADLGGMEGTEDFEDSNGNYMQISKGKLFDDPNKFAVFGGKVDDMTDARADNHYKSFNSKEDAVAYAKELAQKLQSGKDEPSKDSTGGRAGNPQVNKKALEVAKKVGLDPKKIGKEEFTLKIVQAAHEALTDSNFHSEARKLIAIIEDNPELAKNPADDPNKPDLGDPGYEEWQKGTAWGSKYGDSTDETDELGQAAAQEAGWAGRDALDSIAYVAKMKGFKNLAAKIQSVFDDKKNESSMRLNSMLPEGKHKKLERDLKNLAGVAKIDFSEALESLEEDGVLEAMDHLENLIDRIKGVHKQLKRKS